MAKQKLDSLIYQAVRKLVDNVDGFLQGQGLQAQELPPSVLRTAADTLLNGFGQSNSVKTGCLFLVFYKVVCPSYNFTTLPVGYRGALGDKLLGAELKQRHITLGQVTAWGENIGAKGHQENFSLRTDARFGAFIQVVSQAPQSEVVKLSLYMAAKFAKSRMLPAVLPPLSPDVLSFVRAKALFKSLAEAEADGSIQQFLVAALLKVLRYKQNIDVITHNFHAADTYDSTAGDIEEFVEGKLLRAYEVTARPDWKNRLPDFRQKMDKAGLTKYIIIATNVNTDEELNEPAALALKIEAIERDIAVVDIMDFLTVMAAELSPEELQNALQEIYRLLTDDKLGGKYRHIETFTGIVGNWLDEVAAQAQ